MANRLTMIVPRLPPSIDGVGDYALSLARILRHNNIETIFLMFDPTCSTGLQIEGFEVNKIARTAGALASAVDTNSPVLLHYVNYGYEKRGCPIWLIKGLRQLRRIKPDIFIMTFFHELYACGPINSSSFWLSPLQKLLASEIIRVSDRHLTSIHDYANKIASIAGDLVINPTVYPVFSNIPVPDSLKHLNRRDPVVVVFGQKHTRIRAYTVSDDILDDFCVQNGIIEILDVGPDMGFKPQLNNVRVRQLGPLEAHELSEVMNNSYGGYIDYDHFLGRMAKSTIFATYCSHRMLPICSSNNYSEQDGLISGVNYINASVSNVSCTHHQKIADMAKQWYEPHSCQKQAEFIAGIVHEN